MQQQNIQEVTAKTLNTSVVFIQAYLAFTHPHIFPNVSLAQELFFQSLSHTVT